MKATMAIDSGRADPTAAVVPDSYRHLVSRLLVGAPVAPERVALVDLAAAVWSRPGFDTLIAGAGLAFEPFDYQLQTVATVLGRMRKPPRHTVHEGKAAPPNEALRITKEVFFRGHGFVPTPVFRRPVLRSGNRVNGPALIEEHASTTVVHPGDMMTVDGFGNLQFLIGSDRK